MNHFATSKFWHHYRRLPKAIRELADKNFAMLKNAPKHSSLRLKKIRGELWSVRVGLHYRALAIERPEGLYWIWIGPHGEYDKTIS